MAMRMDRDRDRDKDKDKDKDKDSGADADASSPLLGYEAAAAAQTYYDDKDNDENHSTSTTSDISGRIGGRIGVAGAGRQSQSQPEDRMSSAWPAHYDIRCPVFIDGHTLLDELAYAYHFHSRPLTRVLHALGFALFVYGASMVLEYPGFTVLTGVTVLAVLVYSAWMMYLERAAGSVVAGTVLALWGAAYASVQSSAGSGVTPLLVGLALCACVAPTVQVCVGHVFVEQAMSTRFRPMETMCSTPLLITMLAMHSLTRGTYADALVREVQRRAEVEYPYFREET